MVFIKQKMDLKKQMIHTREWQAVLLSDVWSGSVNRWER